MAKDLIYLIPLFPLAGAAFNLLFGRKMSRRVVHAVGVMSIFAAFVVSAILVYRLKQSGIALEQSLYTWIEVGSLKINLAFKIDQLTSVMILIITFVGLLIHIYSTGYMSEEPRYAAYFGYLNLFTGMMLILVLATSLPVMFIGWEGVGLCSYLLIGFWFEHEPNADAGRKAFVVNRIGDAAFLIGMFLLFSATGTLEFDKLASPDAIAAYTSPWHGERMAFFAALLLFIGACGKSAQIPLYVWLPDAMAGPTPVSALIHAATMVTAGVYMVARMGVLFASSTTAMAIVAGVGALTALVAAFMAFAQTDFKKVLAYSTVSQLGFMFVGVGTGAYVAGIFHLMTHAFFKAGLFLSAGSVMHALHHAKDPGDIRAMGGLRKILPITHACFVVYLLAISGIVPFAGFFSKDEILGGAWIAQGEGWISIYGELLWGVLTVAALGTAFYMARLYFLVFAGSFRGTEEARAHAHESPRSMTVPLILLAVFAAGIGFIGMPHGLGLPNYLGEWLAPALPGEALVTAGHASKGLTGILIGVALTMGVVGLGIAYMLYARGPSSRIAQWTSGGLGAKLYDLSLNKLYVDELYEKIIVRPFRWTANALWEFADKFVIDYLFVTGAAFIVSVFGRMARWFQNGSVKRYMYMMMLGAAAIFFLTRGQPDADFQYEHKGGGHVEFHADFGAGPGNHDAKIEWYFQARPGKGVKPDSIEPNPSYRFPRITDYSVTLRVTNSVSHKTRTVTKHVKLRNRAALRTGGGAR